VAVVHPFVDGFNKGDMKMMSATCAEKAAMLDEFPPHECHGAGLREVGKRLRRAPLFTIASMLGGRLRVGLGRSISR